MGPLPAVLADLLAAEGPGEAPSKLRMKAVRETPTAEHWLVVTSDSFAGDKANALRELGLEVDEAARTVRAPFGPLGTVGARVYVRHGRALYLVRAAGSGTYPRMG